MGGVSRPGGGGWEGCQDPGVGGWRGVKTRGWGVGGVSRPVGEGGVWCQDPRGREVVVSADGVGLGGGLTKILAGEVVS